MDTQQMTELLLAMREEMEERMDANTKAMNEKMKELKKDERFDREDMIGRMDANTKATLATQVKMNETKDDLKTIQERAKAVRISDRENETRNGAGQEKIQENLKRTMEEMMNMNQGQDRRKV
jgi:hypothetical protein